MTTTTRLPRPDEHGVGSLRWLLTAALANAARANLDNAIASMLYYMENTDEPNLVTSWDILGQIALTGRYTPTSYEDWGLDEEEEDDENPITEDEINRFIKYLNGFEDGEEPTYD